MKSKVAAIIWFGICSAALLSISAGAYIDPSVVSYTAQAVVGIAIAAGAVFFVWWRKVKSKVSKKLGIDENAGKEVEEDIVINDADNADTSNNSENTADNISAQTDVKETEKDEITKESKDDIQ